MAVTEEFAAMVSDQGRLRAYERLANKLRAIPTSNAALLTISSSVDTVAHEAAKLRDADINVCDFLEQWRRAGWSDAHFMEFINGAPFQLFGINRELVIKAYNRAVQTQIDLRELGLTFGNALEVAAIAGYF